MSNIKFAEKEYSDKEIYALLEPEVAKWFKKKFKKFTPAQRYAVVEIHKGKNVLISSPTGSGKTLSAFLAIINELIKLKKENKLEDKIYAIYISPLRALNNDIHRNLMVPLEGIERRMGEPLGIRVGVRTSDTTAAEKAKQVRKPPHILITTPESLAIALNAPKFSKAMSTTKYAIVDEIHSLAENKRGTHLSLSLERLQHMTGRLVRIGLSATISPLEEVAKFLVGTNRDCLIVNVDYAKDIKISVLSPIEDFIYTPPDVISEKTYQLLDKLIEEHETTLIFTNTRSGTERVVFKLKQMFKDKYIDDIAAHHSSLSREHRLNVEEMLKSGKLKVVISSTSLELGIDIGSIDLVILLGSPKSTSRALQRVGRSGHRLHETSIGYLVALDRDDLVECTVIAKNARDRRLDKVRIVKNALDVLSQHLLGMALSKRWRIDEAYRLVKKAYPYETLPKSDFIKVLRYLSGYYDELEVRNVYGKVWLDEVSGMFGRRGKMGKVIYYMNTGTIPDESSVAVFTRGNTFVGKVEEEFAEKLMQGDRFVLGGKVYEYVYSRGNKIYVDPAEGKKPTIPAWFSEMLPLSYELALDIESFREEISNQKSPVEYLIDKYKVDEKAARAIFNYINEQKAYSIVPGNDTILVEEYIDQDMLRNYIFHMLAGRKANNAIGRAFAYMAGKRKSTNVRVTITDYGFMLTMGRWKSLSERDIKSLLSIDEDDFMRVLKEAIDKSEILRRRFRNVAVRGLMILRRYPSRTLSVGRQQMSADSVLRLLKYYYPNFPLLKETYNEIFNIAFHVDEAIDYLKRVKKKKLVFKRDLRVPSPFAFHIVTTGAKDVILAEDKAAMIRYLHQKLMKEISKRGST